MKTKKILAALLSMSLVLSSAAETVSAVAVILGVDPSGQDVIGGLYDELVGFSDDGRPIIMQNFPEGVDKNHLPDDALVYNENYIYITNVSKITDVETIKSMLESFIEGSGWQDAVDSVNITSNNKVDVLFKPVHKIQFEQYEYDYLIRTYCNENNIDNSLVTSTFSENPEIEDTDRNTDGELITDTETIKSMLEELIEENGWKKFTYDLVTAASEKNTEKVFVEILPVDDLDDEINYCCGKIYDFCRKNNLDQSAVEVIWYHNEPAGEENREKVRTNLLKIRDIIAENGWQECTKVYYNSGKIVVEFNQTAIGEKEHDDDALKLSKLSYEAGVDTDIFSESSIEIQDVPAISPVKSETGDINQDGSIDLTDLTELSLAIIGDKTFTENQLTAADINKNGKADLADLARLRQYISKVITSLR